PKADVNPIAHSGRQSHERRDFDVGAALYLLDAGPAHSRSPADLLQRSARLLARPRDQVTHSAVDDDLLELLWRVCAHSPVQSRPLNEALIAEFGEQFYKLVVRW